MLFFGFRAFAAQLSMTALFGGTLLLGASPLLASSGGIWGYTGRTQSCVACHAPTENNENLIPEVTISSLSEMTQLVAGTTLGFEVRARRGSESSNRWAGFNAEAWYPPWGNLEVVQVETGMKVHNVLGLDSEVSHSTKKDFEQGALLENEETYYEVSWVFHVRLPAHFPLESNSEITVYAAVNNTNGSITTLDHVNIATQVFAAEALAIECGETGAPVAVCEENTFEPILHYFEQAIPCFHLWFGFVPKIDDSLVKKLNKKIK